MHDEDSEDGDAFQLFLISSGVSEMYPPKKYIQIIAITMSDENQINKWLLLKVIQNLLIFMGLH